MRAIALSLAILTLLVAPPARAELADDLFAGFQTVCLANADALPEGAAAVLDQMTTDPPEQTADGPRYSLDQWAGATVTLATFKEDAFAVETCLYLLRFDQPVPGPQISHLRRLIEDAMLEAYQEAKVQAGAGTPKSFRGWRSWDGDLCVTVVLDSQPSGNDRAMAMILTATRRPPPDMDICQPEG